MLVIVLQALNRPGDVIYEKSLHALVLEDITVLHVNF